MKKIIGVIACGLFLNAAAASSQVTDKEKVQMEKRIEKLIKKMTLEEKVGLLHGNSKFYVAGVERLGIPEWSLSDGPHGVRAEINRHDWAYAGWTNDIEQRVACHNSGRGAKYTRSRLPVTLAYWEECADQSEAMRLEARLKKMSRAQKIALIERAKSKER